MFHQQACDRLLLLEPHLFQHCWEVPYRIKSYRNDGSVKARPSRRAEPAGLAQRRAHRRARCRRCSTCRVGLSSRYALLCPRVAQIEMQKDALFDGLLTPGPSAELPAVVPKKVVLPMMLQAAEMFSTLLAADMCLPLTSRNPSPFSSRASLAFPNSPPFPLPSPHGPATTSPRLDGAAAVRRGPVAACANASPRNMRDVSPPSSPSPAPQRSSSPSPVDLSMLTPLLPRPSNAADGGRQDANAAAAASHPNQGFLQQRPFQSTPHSTPHRSSWRPRAACRVRAKHHTRLRSRSGATRSRLYLTSGWTRRFLDRCLPTVRLRDAGPNRCCCGAGVAISGSRTSQHPCPCHGQVGPYYKCVTPHSVFHVKARTVLVAGFVGVQAAEGDTYPIKGLTTYICLATTRIERCRFCLPLYLRHKFQ